MDGWAVHIHSEEVSRVPSSRHPLHRVLALGCHLLQHTDITLLVFSPLSI